ncbi:MAG: 30S ribosomal protein S7 [Nanoarchaeota archaeon]|nr:30S ribosomal protein S7 [Nanoarchaeota archaeon]
MLLFNKWKNTGIELRDPGLMNYINVKPIIIPKTSGRHESKKFWKSKMHVVERLINKMMVPGHKGKEHWWSSGHCSGKTQTIFKIVKQVLQDLENKLKTNPIQVLATAIENSAPKEEVTSIEYGGTRYQRAVDISPQRRVDLALRWMVQGSYAKSVNKKRSTRQALVSEITLAYQNSSDSAAVKKCNEVERQADTSR